MDVSTYSFKDLLLAALKSEVESERVYQTLADRVENAFLVDRLTFLAGEEVKHKQFIEGLFRKNFPGMNIILPEKTDVPLPVMKIPDESIPLSTVFESAMDAEKASSRFYEALAHRVDDSPVQKTLLYFAAMEMNHYKILESEHESMKRFEDFDIEWPMMNVGP
ncbi:MAG: ferritin family protein [Theionarchaea archaeon]|nr:ferritin family protein [Theionarchaea archaeon]